MAPCLHEAAVVSWSRNGALFPAILFTGIAAVQLQGWLLTGRSGSMISSVCFLLIAVPAWASWVYSLRHPIAGEPAEAVPAAGDGQDDLP